MWNLLKRRYDQVKSLFQRTGALLGTRLRALLSGPLDEERLEALEALFYGADLGRELAQELTQEVKRLPHRSEEEVLEALRDLLLKKAPEGALRPLPTPALCLIVGANGSGKTTTVAKLAHLFQQEGRRVLLGAADTFRAAAIEQLGLWAERLGCPIVKGRPQGEAAAVLFDAIQAAKVQGADLLLIDTAGRLHTKHELMQELAKMRRVADKAMPGAPHETWLVLDATMGQNSLEQARLFHEATPLTGLVVTKLDGTAKGGMALAIERRLGIPVRYIGIGEGVEDLRPFSRELFIEALLGIPHEREAPQS